MAVSSGLTVTHKKTALYYVLALFFGVIAGWWGCEFVHSACDLIATAFVRLFKFISVPVIAVSIIATLAGFGRKSGAIFKHTLFYTLLTTILAAFVALAFYLIYAPGNVAVTGSTFAAASKHSYLDYIINVIPDNILTPFASGNVLSVLIVAFATGLAIASMSNKDSQTLFINFFNGLQEILFTFVKWLIAVLPLGIFGFVAQLMVQIKAGTQIGGLGSYFLTIVSANLMQMLVVLPLLLFLRGINPLKIAQAMAPALSLAFFSKSSAATLPLTMSCAENRVKISPTVARFVLPICTTINMNGCAAFIWVTVIYLMQNAGIEITATTMLVWIGIATLAAVGNAGVPMGCFFLATSLLVTMDVPIQLMGVILPFYAVIDMVETTLNVWSDSCVATLVNKDCGQ